MNETEAFRLFRSALADRYVLEEEIGRGGMATVYRARDLKHDRVVAIKVLEPHFGVTLGAERFLREIRIESRLQHPNILALFDSGQIREFLYSVMPFAEGGSLDDLLSRESPLPMDDALRITGEVGEALSHAHGMGILHRDVKPGNILFSAHHAMLSDFGIAQALSDLGEDRLTKSGVSLGTPAYMSPEQASGSARLDERTDLYSLGSMLYEMLTGQPPFPGPNTQAVLAQKVSQRPPPAEIARPASAGAVSSALQKALEPIPADRFPTVEEFLEALTREAPLAVPRSRPVWQSAWARVTAAILLAMALVTGWWITRPEDQELSLNKVAVFPFATRGLRDGGSVDGRGVAYLIGAALEHADPLRFIDVSPRLEGEDLSNPEDIPSQRAQEIAGDMGAGFYLRGVIQGHGDSTTVILQAFDVAGDSLLDQGSAGGPSVTVPIHHLGIDAIQGMLPVLIGSPSPIDLSPLRDRQVNAMALWWQGEREYRTSHFAAALDLYQRALGADSSLAFAAIKGAQAAGWLHQKARAQELAELAVARDSLLPERYVTLARGLKSFYSGEGEAAVTWLRQAVQAYPEWWEAWTALGEVYYHLLPTTEVPLATLAQEAFETALAIDSAGPPLFHMLEIKIRKEDRSGLDLLFQRFKTDAPEPALERQISLMRECVWEPSGMDWSRHVREAPDEVLLAGKSLSVAGRQLPCAEGAFRAVLDDPEASQSQKWGAFLGLESLLVAQGRDDEARTLVDSVAETKGAARSLYVISTLAGGDMREPSAQLEAFARERYGSDYSGVQSYESLWVLSLWLEHAGELDKLERLVQTTRTRRSQGPVTPQDRAFADAIAARWTLQSDTLRAIERLSQLVSSPTDPGLSWGFGDGLPQERLVLSELLLQSGRYREALAAGSVFDHPAPVMFLQFVPKSLVVRIEAAQGLGDDGRAEALRARLKSLGRASLLANLN